MMIAGVIVPVVVVMMVVMTAVVSIAIVAAGDRIAGQATQNRAADRTDSTMRGHAADDCTTAGAKHRTGGVIVPAAGIRQGRHGGRAEHDDSGHYHRGSLFQHGNSPCLAATHACPLANSDGERKFQSKAGSNA
jgi:hypothetical protein